MDYPATFEFNAPEKVARWRVVGNFNVRASAYWSLLTDRFPPLGLS